MITATFTVVSLVYDQHNVIFAYGDLARYEKLLRARGLSEREFWFPASHSHWYPATNWKLAEAVLAHLPWQRFPLQKGDEWD